MNSHLQTTGPFHVPANKNSPSSSGSSRMRRLLNTSLAALCFATAALSASTNAYASQDASTAASTASMLPVASLLVGGSAVAGSVATVPLALSTSGAVLVVKAVESTARGTELVLERLSDGARVSLEIAGRSIAAASVAVGTTVTVSLIAAGCILSVAQEAIAFVPNKLGHTLLHNEQVTY
ncbi:hypothetical protein EDC30_101528 [Paucimonas lemoignei]|uniref:Uncharacterized protein n=1 Tax=Paucimonas lemoignei TaxID=29443 RepID=A0A4R3I1Z1_PAULE|nr:hypothetical protein [Paucimonas lemoignei]TCS39572.1 hypothetical protein EDC30_101528 [Paucimonas lemoignei]